MKSSLLAAGPLSLRKENSFELFGYDFMLDAELRPWLIEVNSSPSLEYSTPVTTALVQQVIEDTIAITIDKSPGHTGNFVLCYKQ